jgi:hypothetical protein
MERSPRFFYDCHRGKDGNETTRCGEWFKRVRPETGKPLSGWLLFRNLFLQFIRLLPCFGYNEMYFRN